ncbi:DUF222 domain-containing protein [Gryllotalpicola reticulitermitis]|uniref:DUF222 domain-containing protein n=1 Tax=Gryllotalpicola reticulitermitis TaxID=1184153 RepID=A0ABV8Q9P1_9MICO
MAEIIRRVRELTASAVDALPDVNDVAVLSGAATTTLLTELAALRRRVDAAISLVAADIDRKSARDLGPDSLARRAGVKSGAELVQKITGSTRGDAIKAVRVGGMLETAHAIAPLASPDARERGTAPRATLSFEPAPRSLDVLRTLTGAWDAPVAVAMRNGWLSTDQGDRLRAALGEPSPAERGGAWRDAALQLIDDCWQGELTAEDVSRAAKAMRACLDREWARENAERLHSQRSLKRVVRADGMVKYDLLVDPLTDAEIWTPLFRHLAPRLGGPRFMTAEERERATELELDPRSNEQLLADALTGFVAAGVAASGEFGKYVPTVNIAVTTTELRSAIASPGDGLGWLDGVSQPVGGAQIVSAICNGAVAGVLFDETGRAIDATKAERTFSTRQRKALALRDGGCLWPGCTMPPAACEAHHVNPWSEHELNHKTETRDGVLLCRFHHLNLHNQGGRVERRGSRYSLDWPGREPVRLIPKHGVIAQLRVRTPATGC